MAVTQSITFGVEELNALRISRAPEIRDHQARSLPFIDCCNEVHGEGAPSKDGAQRWLYGIEIDDHSVPTQLTTGYEAINLSTIPIDRQFVFSPGFATMPVLISVVEENVYNGSDALYDQADKRMKNVINAFMRRWHLHMLTGAQAGFGGWGTLNGVDVSTGSHQGIIEQDAYGSQGNTVGGLSKSTLSTVPGMNNQSYNLNSALGSNGRAAVFDQMNRIKEFSDEGKYAALATQAAMTGLQRIMAPYMQWVHKGGKDEKVDMSSPTVFINGFRSRQTSHLPTGGAAAMSILLLNLEDIHPVWLRSKTDGFFGMTDWVQHSGDYRVKVAYVECNGQLVAEAFHTSSLLYDGESF